MNVNIVLLIAGLLIAVWLMYLRHLEEKTKTIIVALMGVLAVLSFVKNSSSGAVLFFMILGGISYFTSFFLIHINIHNMRNAKLRDFPKEVWLDFFYILNVIWASLIFAH